MFRPARSLSGFALAACLLSPLNAQEFSPGRTEFGHPDFQGNWTTETATPFQRPEELGEKATYTLEEMLAVEAENNAEMDARAAPIDGPIEAPEVAEFVSNSAEDQFKNRVVNVLQVKGEYRTSILVDPPNGRLPLREDANDNTFMGRFFAAGHERFEGPELTGPGPRCLVDYGALPPAVPIVPLSPNYQFVQTEDYVLLYIEAGAELRVIRLSDEPLSPVHKNWRGDSLGRWDGDTLKVRTTNFHPQSSAIQMLMSEALEVEEEFTMVSEDEIFYRFTVTDPNIYTAPYSGELTLSRMPEGERIFDYACHEGNYTMPGILAGARRLEIDAEFAEED